MSTSSTDRPMRADARRNREKVLEAARAAFADQGLDAQIDDVARRAGVGVGTVYRHFPTKDALVEAVAVDKVERLIANARAALAEEDDPWRAFERTVRGAAGQTVGDAGLADIIFNHPETLRATEQVRAELTQVGEELVRRAVAAGAMRADATVTDIPTIMCGLSSLLHAQRCGAPFGWERYLELMLDGLRAR